MLAAGDQVKCSPAVDPRTGLVWCGSHGKRVVALDLHSKTAKYETATSGSVFAAPAVDLAKPQVCRGVRSSTNRASNASTSKIIAAVGAFGSFVRGMMGFVDPYAALELWVCVSLCSVTTQHQCTLPFMISRDGGGGCLHGC